MNHSDPPVDDKLKAAHPHGLAAKHYFSGFEEAHDTYNALSTASDGKVYYILSSQSIDKGGQMFCYDPDTDAIKYLGDLGEICGESKQRVIPQGKSHVNFHEREGKLYFATHVGFYETVDGMETLPLHPPKGYHLYRGGHILSCDLATYTFADLAVAPDGEGILTMTMDETRGHIYCITWPQGYFIHYDLKLGKLTNLGPVSLKGEAGIPGKDYRVLCRSMFVDPREGAVYYSTADGDIFSYSPTVGAVSKLDHPNLRLDYFGKDDPSRPGDMAYNWRKIFWHPFEEVAYAVHGNSGYLFRFDPRKKSVEIVERITSLPSRTCGMFDQFSYGYLGFQLGPDQETIYYLTGGPVFANGHRINGTKQISKGDARGPENLHLVTYHLPSGTYRDHGPIYYADGTRPTYVNTIAVTKKGDVFMLARCKHEGKIIQDLVKIPDPFRHTKSILKPY